MFWGSPSSVRNAKKYEKKDSKSAVPKASASKPSGSGKRPAEETPKTGPVPKKTKTNKNKAKK